MLVRRLFSTSLNARLRGPGCLLSHAVTRSSSTQSADTPAPDSQTLYKNPSENDDLAGPLVSPSHGNQSLLHLGALGSPPTSGNEDGPSTRLSPLLRRVRNGVRDWGVRGVYIRLGQDYDNFTL